MAKTLSALNPAAVARTRAIASGSIARSSYDSLVNNYSAAFPDEIDALSSAIQDGSIRVFEQL